MSEDSNTRRRFLQATGAAATLAIAGCTGGGGGGGGDGEDTTTESNGDDSDNGDTETDTTTSGEMTTTSGSMEVPSEVSDYLSNTGNFDGSVEDMTGTGNVEVTVGAQGNGGAFAFGPAAIRIDAGTDVNWAWNGEGGSHNVVHEDGEFESSLVSSSGNDFQHTFEETGVYLYYCAPHKSLGMKGAVIVV
jgi:halocyanin-like protein